MNAGPPRLERLSDAEIATRLDRLPHWALRDGAIERRYQTENFKATMLAAAAVGHLCEAAWHHPEMTITYNVLVVRLWTHAAKGITDRDFELASKLDAVVGWQPALEGGALTGPPRDPRFAYIRHE